MFRHSLRTRVVFAFGLFAALLGIDPYPRKAGAEFAAIQPADDSAKPFAALEALKKRLGG